MAGDFPTEDDINKMYHQYLKDEFAGNKESITDKKKAFLKQLAEVRNGQSFNRDENAPKAANDNQKQQQQKEGLNNAHNSGQGKQSEKARAKEAEKQKFKDLLREARGEQRSPQEKEFANNSKDVAGDKQAEKEAAYKTNGRDITGKKEEPKEKPGKHTPQPPTPGKSFTRTWGRERD